MKHHGGAADERRNFRVVADVGPLQVDRFPHLFQVGFPPRQQVVDDHNPPGAFPQKPAHNRGTDEASPSRDNVVAHDGNRPRFAMIS